MGSNHFVRPKKLRPGHTIGVIAPASPGEAEAVQAGCAWLEAQGFRVAFGSAAYEASAYLAGSDRQRAADINAMFAAPHIDGIICLRGGYGSMRLLDMLDYETIRAHPKVFVGYSDITALHISIGQLTGLVTFHGPMVAADMGKALPAYTAASFLRAVTLAEPAGEIENPPLTGQTVTLAPGRAEGCLTGGNLSIIAATLGTPYEIDTQGKILCLEEVGEEPYRLDRMLTQLLLAGKLQAAAGIAVAVCSGCDAGDASGGSVQEVLVDRLCGLGKPVLTQLYFGHTPEKATLPLGVAARLDCDSITGRLTVLERAVEE